MNRLFPRTHLVTWVRGTPQTGHLPQGQALLNPDPSPLTAKGTQENREAGVFIRVCQMRSGGIPGLGPGMGRAKGPQSGTQPSLPPSLPPSQAPSSSAPTTAPTSGKQSTKNRQAGPSGPQLGMECKMQASAFPQRVIWGAQCILPTRIK